MTKRAATGRPIDVTAYHGTRSLTAILASGLRVSGSGEFGPGIYLAPRPETASFYALYVARGPDEPVILAARVVLVNPFRVDKLDWLRMTARSTPRTVQQRLIKRGHDGLVGAGLTGEEQIVALGDADGGERAHPRVRRCACQAMPAKTRASGSATRAASSAWRRQPAITSARVTLAMT